ncbi:MAG: hypothetical protein QGH07_02705 [Alphaproteobacteria bacterium]|nr:hypothetical protein [Alphaproteobacteria bacterium]
MHHDEPPDRGEKVLQNQQNSREEDTPEGHAGQTLGKAIQVLIAKHNPNQPDRHRGLDGKSNPFLRENHRHEELIRQDWGVIQVCFVYDNRWVRGVGVSNQNVEQSIRILTVCCRAAFLDLLYRIVNEIDGRALVLKLMPQGQKRTVETRCDHLYGGE